MPRTACYIIFYLFFLFQLCNGQTKKIDSLRNSLSLCRHDTCKMKTLNSLASRLSRFSPDTSIVLSREALALAEKLIISSDPASVKWGKKGKAQSEHQLGYYNSLKGDYVLALEHYKSAIAFWEDLTNSPDPILSKFGRESISKSFINVGVIYNFQANYPEALDFLLKGLKLAEQAGQKQWQANALGNLGVLYVSLANFTKALEYYTKSLKMDEELGDKIGVATNYTNIGNVYYNLMNYSKTLDYHFKALKLAEELGETELQINSLNNIGGVYLNLANYKNALDNFFKALELADRLESKPKQATILGNIGSAFTKTGKFNEAEKYLKNALSLSTEIEAVEIMMNHEQFLSQLYDTTNRPALAFVHFKKYIIARDSINSTETQRKLARSEINFEFEKRELNTKVEQAKKDIIAKEELKQKEQQRNYFIIGFGLVGLLSIFIFRSYRQKQKANILITEQKRMVDEHQKEILDSIRYAKKIQQALLPTEKYIAKYLTGR